MEKIITIPGLQHLAEKVFLDLDVQDLNMCAQINQSCKQILESPIFWMKKFRSPSKQENQKEWIFKAAQDGYTEIVKILVPLTDNPNAPNIWGFSTPIHMAACNGHTEIVEILAPMTKNPDAPNVEGATPIYWASYNGHIEIVKILAPLTENPNAPDKHGVTPIFHAAKNGHTEIVNILTPLTDNPNAPNKNGVTPIHVAKDIEILRILQSFVTSA